MKYFLIAFLILSACQPQLSNYKVFRKTIYQEKDDNQSIFSIMMEVAKGIYKVDSIQTLTVGNYYISKHQITTDQFAYFLNNVIDTIDISVKEYIKNFTIINTENSQLQLIKDQIIVNKDHKFQPMTNVNYYGAEAYSKWLTEYQNTLFKQQNPSKTKYQKHYSFRIPQDTEWIIGFSCYDSLNTRNLLTKPSNFDSSSEIYDIVNTYNTHKYNSYSEDSTFNEDSTLLFRPSKDTKYELQIKSKSSKMSNIGFRIVQTSIYSNNCDCDSW